VTRRNDGRGHSYWDDAGERVQGVTRILDKAVPKPGLIGWAANATVDHYMDHRDELASLPMSEAVKRLTAARNVVNREATVKGTRVHKLASSLAVGLEVVVPPELDGYVRACVAFLDGWDAQTLYAERAVWSDGYDEPDVLTYAGTFDLIADVLDWAPETRSPWDNQHAEIGRRRVLLDWKTGNGVYGETAWQLAAYRYAHWMDDGTATPMTMPPVDDTMVVHLRGDGTYEVIPLEAGPDQWEDFLTLMRSARVVASARDLIGEPLDPPARTEQP